MILLMVCPRTRRSNSGGGLGPTRRPCTAAWTPCSRAQTLPARAVCTTTRACPGLGLVCACKRPGLPGPRQSAGSAGTWLSSERPWAQPGRCVAPLYGLEPGPSGEVRDRCVRLNGLEPGRIPVGALNRAAARAPMPQKNGGRGTFVPPPFA